jgi:hypothetical protein
MVEVRIIADTRSLRIEGSGHALFDRKGRDIACSAVSTLLQSYYFGIKGLTKAKTTHRQEPGLFEMEITEPDQDAELLTRFLALNLSELREEFPSNIKMTVEEAHGRRKYS